MSGYDEGKILTNDYAIAAEAIAVGEVCYLDSSNTISVVDDAVQFTAQFRMPAGICKRAAAAGEAVSMWDWGSKHVDVVAGTGGFTVGDQVVVEKATGYVIGLKTGGQDQDPLPYTGTWCLGYAMSTQTTAGSLGKIRFDPFMFNPAGLVWETVDEAAGVVLGQPVMQAGGEVTNIDAANQAAAQQLTPFGVCLADTADGAVAPIAISGLAPALAGTGGIIVGDYVHAEDVSVDVGFIPETGATTADNDWIVGTGILAASAGSLGAIQINIYQQQLA